MTATYAWAAPYAGLDDDALKALGNAGLLRRARKDLGGVTEVSHDAKGAVLDVSGASVRVDGRGPSAVACDCPTAGVCQHVLTACLWAVGVAPEVPEPAAAAVDGRVVGGGGIGPASGDAAAGLVSGGSASGGSVSGGSTLGGSTVDGPGGGAAEGAEAGGPVPRGSGPGWPATGGQLAGAVVAQAVPRAGAPTVRRPSEAVLRRRRAALAEVRDVVGRLVSGGLSHLGPDDAETLAALAGRVRLAGFERVGTVRFDGLLRVAGGLVAGLAGRDDAVTEQELLDAFAEVWAMCEVLRRALDGPAPDGGGRALDGGGRAPDGGGRALDGGGPGPSGGPGSGGGPGPSGGPGRGGGRAPDGAVPGSSGSAAGWAAAAGATGSVDRRQAAAGGGAGGNADDETDVARWVPLGARWWTSQSGARGLAYLGWDTGVVDGAPGAATGVDGAPGAVSAAGSDAGAKQVPDAGPGTGAGPAADTVSAGRVRQVVTGRSAATDPRFQRSWTSPLLWGRSVSTLCEGAFTLAKVRTRPDGALGAGGNPVLQRLGGDGFDLDELRVIADRTGAGVRPRDVVGFGRRPVGVRLVLVRDVGEVGIDEVRQEMTLTVVSSDGDSHLLRLPVAGEQAVETLLSVRSRLVAVTIERREGRDEPVGLFVRDKNAIRLVSPTITPAWTLERTYWDFWRRRMRKLRAQASAARTVRASAAPPPPVRRVTLLLGDVLLAAAATGRPTLTTRQRSDVEQARALARDLGLATLERTADGLLGDDLTPAAVLHAAFVVGRARAVADVAG